jgi:predicted P-loop ATPase
MMRDGGPSAQEGYDEAREQRREALTGGSPQRGNEGPQAGGSDFIALEPPKHRRCDQCGAFNPIDATTCNGCGADLGPPPPPTKTAYMGNKSTGACNLANTRLALRQEPALMNRFGFDEMSRTEMLMRPFVADPDFKPRPVTDVDIIKIQSWLQTFGFRKIGEKSVRDAITDDAHNHPYHPVRDYLDRVAASWDGKPRVGTWLVTYAGAALVMEKNEATGVYETSGYVEEVGKMFLVGMVARIYRPGCKFDYQLILEGPEQGMQKSKMCETLVGEEYFSDQLPPIEHKDASQHLRGKWLIEMPEMHAYTRAEISKYKEFMTRRIERYRPTYARKDVIEPRQCAFIGTTNKMVYLRDETGNRRSWPVATGEIDIEALERDRDQLWAEAVHLFRGGVHWWPDRIFEREHIRPQQEARFESDPWEPLIKKYLDRLIDQAVKAQPSYVPETTVLKIAVNVLGYTIKKTVEQGELVTPISRLDPKIGQRISAVLHHLGWVPKHDKRGRWWEPGPKAQQGNQ